MEKEVLEVILKKCRQDSSIERIISVDSIPAVSKGQNYSSNVFRLKLKVVLGNGRVTSKSLILKNVINDANELISSLGVLEAENKIYSVILKEMDYLMEEIGDTDEKPWCNFLYCDMESSSLLMEDIKAEGYRLVPRQKCHDLDEGILVLRTYGRFHAMAKILEERGFISKDSYNKHPLMSNERLVKTFLHAGLKRTSKGMISYWGDEWKSWAEKLEIPFTEYFDKLKEICEYSESDFTVLNHGDCWSNNIMIKYDWQERPTSVKLLDFQICHYNTPCVDLTNYIYSSIQPSVRRGNFQKLLENYHDSLIKTLEKFGYTGTKPTIDEITANMDRLQFFGLSMFFGVHKFQISEMEEPFELDEIVRTEGEGGYCESIMNEDGMIEKLGPDIIYYINKYL